MRIGARAVIGTAFLTACGVGSDPAATAPAASTAPTASAAPAASIAPTASTTPIDASAATVAVPVELLLDLTSTLPAEAGAIDLGSLAPPGRQPFCTAYASVPWDWFNDAVVPLQLWIDTYAGVTDIPPEAAEPLAALRAFADRRMRWQFGQLDVRPEFTADLTLSALAVADAAVAHCEELPIIIVRPGSDRSSNQEPADPQRCADELAELTTAIAGFIDRQARQPGHVDQVEIEAYYDFAFAGGDLFVAGDLVGVTLETAGTSVATVAPGGACDG